MKQFDFTTLRSRKDQSSYKWEAMYKNNPNIGDEIVPLSVADMEFVTATAIRNGLQEALDEVILGYTQMPQTYVQAVQRWFKRRHHFDIQSEWILATTGVVPAFYHAIEAFSEPGDAIALMSPVYYPFSRAIEGKKRKRCDCPLILREQSYHIDFDTFEELARKEKIKILLFCSPHNPVSRVWTREELKKLEAILLQHQILLVSDEIHCDILMPGQRHTVFQTLSEEIAQQCITLVSASKSFNLAGLGVANAIIPNPELRKRYQTTLYQQAATAYGILNFKATELAYERAEDWFDAMCHCVYQNACLFRTFIQKEIPEIQVFPHEGSYLLWFDCRALGLDHLELEKFMTQEAKLYLDEGYIFGESGQGFERINLAAPTWVIQAALERLKQAVQKLKTQR